MSSAISPKQSTADHADGLGRALTQVAEESFYAFVDPVGRGDWGELVAAHEEWLAVEVTFSGAFAGRIECLLPTSLARELTAAFLGISDEEIDGRSGAVADLAGELANMLCGRWLTATYPTELFSLTHPEVRAQAEAPPFEGLCVALNGSPVAARLATGEAFTA